MRNWLLALLVCAGLSAWHYLPFPTQAALAPKEPLQTWLSPGDPAPWTKGDVQFKPLAHYLITARILHRDNYYLDHFASICPVDFALGWGRMSDPAVYNQLNIDQGGRLYWWRFFGPGPLPLPVNEINFSSANTHLIPANSSIGHQLFFMREGDVVRLSGYLIKAQWPDGSTVTSSLTRTDTGLGACEVMWVDSAAVVAR